MSTLIAGALLLLISFITNYGDESIFQLGNFAAADKIGVGLHLAALAALLGDVELASRLRYRVAWTRQREALEAARDREQSARRTRIQARCFVAQCRFHLADTARSRLQLSEALAVLVESFS